MRLITLFGRCSTGDQDVNAWRARFLESVELTEGEGRLEGPLRDDLSTLESSEEFGERELHTLAYRSRIFIMFLEGGKGRVEETAFESCKRRLRRSANWRLCCQGWLRSERHKNAHPR